MAIAMIATEPAKHNPLLSFSILLVTGGRLIFFPATLCKFDELHQNKTFAKFAQVS